MQVKKRVLGVRRCSTDVVQVAVIPFHEIFLNSLRDRRNGVRKTSHERPYSSLSFRNAFYKLIIRDVPSVRARNKTYLIMRQMRLQVRFCDLHLCELVQVICFTHHYLEMSCFLVLDERPSVAFSPRSRRSANTMYVLTHVNGRVVTHNVRDVADVYTTRDKI